MATIHSCSMVSGPESERLKGGGESVSGCWHHLEPLHLHAGADPKTWDCLLERPSVASSYVPFSQHSGLGVVKLSIFIGSVEPNTALELP